MRGFQFVFELFLPLQSFDERFLRQILRVMHVAHNAIDLAENAPQIVVDEALLQLPLDAESDTVSSKMRPHRRPALGRALSFEPAAQESAFLCKD